LGLAKTNRIVFLTFEGLSLQRLIMYLDHYVDRDLSLVKSEPIRIIGSNWRLKDDLGVRKAQV